MNILRDIAHLLAKHWIPDIESNSQWIFHNITPGYDTRVHIELIKQEPIEVSNEVTVGATDYA